MIKHTVFSYLVAAVTTAILLFLPAGTIFYWQGWVFMALFFIPMAFIALYMVKRSPELLKRRLDTKERKPLQVILAKLFYITVSSIFVISGLDKRYSWSSLPITVIMASGFIFLAGYWFLFLVFKENKYLAHTVTVEEGQETVTTGPYAVVRHPMYLAELIMFVFAPMLLGSYWGIAPNILLVIILVIRIITEEEVLLQGLKGYGEYVRKTRYRLIPGIW
jgi:protein-S-isoprenylcysteine O-methyltransferase Ste14